MNMYKELFGDTPISPNDYLLLQAYDCTTEVRFFAALSQVYGKQGTTWSGTCVHDMMDINNMHKILPRFPEFCSRGSEKDK